MIEKPDKEAFLHLKALEIEGVEEVYIEPSGPIEAAPIPASAPAQAAKSAPKKASSPLRDEMIALRENALKCTLCKELSSTRTNVVFGAGNLKADLMFIGEAPGHDEDQQGLPFVGRAGQLLTKIIESIGLDRKKVFIANTLKCRPPKNRQPQPEEILNCEPFLDKQIELIRPKIICALGTYAAQTLLKTGESISKLRGKFADYPKKLEDGSTIKVMCTYHPAYLLRSPSEKVKVWEDMKLIRKELTSLG